MPPDKPGDPVPALTDKLQELEQLIPAQRNSAAAIPVLDEVVEPGETDDLPGRIEDLERRLQERLDAELADLTDVLKGVITRCIKEELGAREKGSDR